MADHGAGAWAARVERTLSGQVWLESRAGKTAIAFAAAL